ncbi:MAG: 16S rRNA (cytidine(1402)-2'-O)-methyltransferase [Zoogloeaceae bacterium]|uniref:16S rRNA (cytidine(1402)-2'-O)-methyltransferase n=1 Tax=Denitromonas sp. TaxID=2734609 RepID=UPI001D567D86|nr:16S rRNA (cytidine(1402)-2'-O)-methyltransferase [Rhodocyclaceae bacterium]MCP5221646.1 16S rRNA (cytidine(1402)-2'-O)-methyltransferase [Zoogloeaceae bacterium]HPR07784.1 16S rRNA (cytidine(1402)-2'-O)-methyltransferase [Denitromonas sp.]
MDITESPLSRTPSLYVVATPMGNLQDITLRALAVLRAVDVVAAEDTRHTKGLLSAHGIAATMMAAHEHNEAKAATQIIARLVAGEQVAFVSDAGTPGISDPGARLVAAVRAAGHPVVPVPGPSAVVTAMSVAGFVEGGFHFVGFLPPKSGARRSRLEALREGTDVTVFYEAPHRVRDSLRDMAEVLGPDRELVVARELTKRFEEIARLPLGEAQAWLDADSNRERGEFVLLVSGAPPVEGLDVEAERVLKLLLAELPTSAAAKLAAEITGQPKNALYQRALAIKSESESGL